MVNNCCILCTSEKTAKDIFNIISIEMSFASEREKGIVPFEFLGVVKDYNGVDIKQTSHYVEMSCENYLHCLSKTHDWVLADKNKVEAS